MLGTPPGERVQFLLGTEFPGPGEASLEPHPLFSEMEELFFNENGEPEWKETARSESTDL